MEGDLYQSERFDELIWESQLVCDNCYRQIAETEQRNYHVTYDGGEPQIEPSRDMVKEIGHEEYRRVTGTEAYARNPTGGTRSACDCGALRHDTIDRPVSSYRALVLMNRAIRIYKGHGIEMNEHVAIARAAHDLRNPDLQHKQDQVIARACDSSING